MASAGLKRPSDFDLNVSSPHGSPNSCWSSANKRRCTSFAMQQQPNMMSPSASSSSSGQPNHSYHSSTPCATTSHHQYQHYHHHQPSTSVATSLASSPFKDPASILSSLSDDVISVIRNEIQKAHHNHQQQQHQQQQHTPQQYHQHQRSHQPQTTNSNQYHQNHHHQQQDANSSPDHHDPPVLTVRQTQMICEKLIREREYKLREEYDKILITKLAEQYDDFVKYTQDHIEKRYNETNSHQASYLS